VATGYFSSVRPDEIGLLTPTIVGGVIRTNNVSEAPFVVQIKPIWLGPDEIQPSKSLGGPSVVIERSKRLQ
jgi:hypothetical protein